MREPFLFIYLAKAGVYLFEIQHYSSNKAYEKIIIQ